MLSVPEYREEFISFLEKKPIPNAPEGLYSPISYILNLGGKRLRPVLTLLTASIFDGDYKNAMNAALAIETFHNFSLMHDDIMDEAPLRRGKITVHEKWNLNTGILSGDAMLILAYQLFENYEDRIFKDLAILFSKTALEVCEGQQFDMDFETREDVTITEYLKMITYKTAVLVAAAMKMGAIVAETNEENANLIYDFGLNLGIAFQIQDDYLDTFGDPEKFGKQVGGDIIESKKTFLYLAVEQNGAKENVEELRMLFSIMPKNPKEKIRAVKEIYNKSGASESTEKEIEKYTLKAFSVLEKLDIKEEKKQVLKTFGIDLMQRSV
ncbi:MAG: polyprenyl synthetase family protein [Cellulophaga sp.]